MLFRATLHGAKAKYCMLPFSYPLPQLLLSPYLASLKSFCVQADSTRSSHGAMGSSAVFPDLESFALFTNSLQRVLMFLKVSGRKFTHFYLILLNRLLLYRLEVQLARLFVLFPVIRKPQTNLPSSIFTVKMADEVRLEVSFLNV